MFDHDLSSKKELKIWKFKLRINRSILLNKIKFMFNMKEISLLADINKEQ